MINHYRVLRVSENATTDEIRAAHRRLSKRCHPDVHGGALAAEERQKQLNAAREVLCDADLRRKYDHERRTMRASAQPRPPAPASRQYKPVAMPPSDSGGSSGWGWIAFGVGMGLGIAAAASNKKDANGRFRGRDGRFRSGRWG